MVILTIAAAATAQEKNTREGVDYLAAEKNVLESLGNAKGLDLISLPGLHTFAGLPAAEAHFRTNTTSLEGQNISTALKPFTQKIASIEKNLAIFMEVSKPMDFTAVQKLLGDADGAFSHDDEDKVDWHKYGWLKFGVRDGKVIRLRADCLQSQKMEAIKEVALPRNDDSWRTDWKQFVDNYATNILNKTFVDQKVAWNGVLLKSRDPTKQVAIKMDPPLVVVVEGHQHEPVTDLILVPDAADKPAWDKVMVGQKVGFETKLKGAGNLWGVGIGFQGLDKKWYLVLTTEGGKLKTSLEK